MWNDAHLCFAQCDNDNNWLNKLTLLGKVNTQLYNPSRLSKNQPAFRKQTIFLP